MENKRNTFVYYDRERLKSFFAPRKDETKVGEQIHVPGKDGGIAALKSFREQGGRFVVFGVPESVGPTANLGQTGAQNGWNAFLAAFTGMQHNRFLDASSIMCLGHVEIRDVQGETARLQKSSSDYLDMLREMCAKIDARVIEIVREIRKNDLIPILIGGGHNNAYPLLKACSEVAGTALNCINCDPHADYRSLEGRHSGNSFSYAAKDGALNKYAVIGLHRNYNSEKMLTEMDSTDKIHYSFLEDTENWQTEVDKAIKFVKSDKHPAGLELDMDSIAFMPVSAFTPDGLNISQARKYLRNCTKQLKPVYLHLPEAAPLILERDDKIAGKALAYLLADFISSYH